MDLQKWKNLKKQGLSYEEIKKRGTKHIFFTGAINLPLGGGLGGIGLDYYETDYLLSASLEGSSSILNDTTFKNMTLSAAFEFYYNFYLLRDILRLKPGFAAGFWHHEEGKQIENPFMDNIEISSFFLKPTAKLEIAYKAFAIYYAFGWIVGKIQLSEYTLPESPPWLTQSLLGVTLYLH